MADFQQERKPLPKTSFDEFKLRISGPAQEGARRPPSLKVAVIKNNPRIDVFTNIEGDKDNGRISAPMDAFTFFALITKVEDLAKGEPDQQIKIANKTGAPGQQRAISHTVLGKDKEGRVFISVIAQDRPKIKFTFLPTDWHSIAYKDGSPMEEAELSQLYARGWAKLMAELAPNVMDSYFEENQFNKGGKPAGGGYNKGSGGGGQRNQKSEPGDNFGGSHSGDSTDFGGDDFPM